MVVHGRPHLQAIHQDHSGRKETVVRGFSVLAAQKLWREQWLRSLADEFRREEEVKEEEGGEPGELAK